jgi:hypothetical protein
LISGGLFLGFKTQRHVIATELDNLIAGQSQGIGKRPQRAPQDTLISDHAEAAAGIHGIFQTD